MTPSAFYRTIRPEFFSDSDIQTDYELPKEVLALELEKITTNQKESAFETFARRLAEKRISPNLIPQVGPTGGGDGKTDFETHLVSKEVSDRWFIPENGWNNNEKWAFAISAKKDWKPKLRSDIKSILSTNRGYSQIFFITNQKVSSKVKKELEEAHKTEFNIPVTILDAEWIIESVYNNNLIDLAVDSLNMSDSYKLHSKKIGKNDTERIDRLNELESNISNPKRYSENDYQLVEDALEAAILSRMLEKPKEEVMGRFDRVFRFSTKHKNHQQKIRLHYQRAWTYLQFYDDFSGFIDDYRSLKLLLKDDCTIPALELYFNLFNLLRNVINSESLDVSAFSINLEEEEKEIKTFLLKFAEDSSKPTSSLISKTHIAILDLTKNLFSQKNPEPSLVSLKDYMESSKGHLEYPFEQFQEMIEKFGVVLPNNKNYDALIDSIAAEAEVRSSELSAGSIYLRRGGQKLIANNYKDSVIYFGKALLKLAKEESQYGFGLAMRALGEAYSGLDLLWAANNCYIASCSLTFKSFFEKGIVDPRTYRAVVKLLGNELFIGRAPSFLIWNELYEILERVPQSSSENEERDENDLEEDLLFDACLSVRLLHSKTEQGFQYLPSILDKNGLTLSESTALYKLGYVDKLIKEEYGIPAKSESELDAYFKKWAEQPFVNQIRYETNLLFTDQIVFTSNILGCSFKVLFGKDKELYWAAEIILAFFEGILGTSLSGVIPGTESITIRLTRNETEQSISYKSFNDSSNEFEVELNSFEFNQENRRNVWEKLISLFAEIVGKNFFFKDAKAHLKKLFEEEEVSERLGLLLEHRKFSRNVLGDSPKFFLSDWVKEGTEFPNTRVKEIQYLKANGPKVELTKEFDENDVRHIQRKVSSVINDQLWNQSIWQAFGSFSTGSFFGIFLGFKNGEPGQKIFEEWITRFGKEDKEEKIRICIVKGIDKENPHFYRVVVTSKLDKEEIPKGGFVYTAFRIHEMNPTSSKNLDDLVSMYNQLKYFILIPAEFDSENLRVRPFFNLGIKKNEISIRNAWEIGDHDPDMPCIKKGDDPVIPDSEVDPPIKRLLDRLRKERD